ncbi:MAG: hypothetical protein IJI45_09170 [Anaerolineaceae bacterium]|nr:hypothetical protein [Anaerolineaceae bacterium]
MKIKTVFNKLISIVLSFTLIVPLTAQKAYATTASHSLGTGAWGADYCTVWNYYYGQNTKFGNAVSNHFLTYNGVSQDAFCMNPYLNCGDSYSEGTYTKGYGAIYSLAVKYVAMYNDGYPQGYTEQQRKMAVQLAIFDTSQMGTDYAPPNKANHWYDVMFSGGTYGFALSDLWSAASSYTAPSTSATLGAPQNITNVHLTYNSSKNAFEATVNAGSNAQYYSWSGYAIRSGNYITFSVPASDITSWTGTYNGCPAYTSGNISGSGPMTKIVTPTMWTAGSNYQPLLTVETGYMTPQNTVRYSLYVDGMDEGRPGGGGGLYGGLISQNSATAGGGSGYVGSASNVTGGNTAQNGGSNPVPDGSDNGYARITLVN